MANNQNEACLVCEKKTVIHSRGLCRSCYTWYLKQRSLGRLTDEFMISTGKLHPKDLGGRRIIPQKQEILDAFSRQKSEETND